MNKIIAFCFLILVSCTGPTYTDTSRPKAPEETSTPVCLAQDGSEATCDTDNDCCSGFSCVKEDQTARSHKTCVWAKVNQ